MTSLTFDERNFGIEFYWDINTTPVPHDVQDPFSRITKALQTFGSNYELRRVIVYGDFDNNLGAVAFRKKYHHDLGHGFKILVQHRPKRIPNCNDCPEASSSNKQDLAEHCLKQDMYDNCSLLGPPYIILIATSNSDFCYQMYSLRKMGMKMLLACDEKMDDDRDVVSQMFTGIGDPNAIWFDRRWYWETKMLKGLGPEC